MVNMDTSEYIEGNRLLKQNCVICSKSFGWIKLVHGIWHFVSILLPSAAFFINLHWFFNLLRDGVLLAEQEEIKRGVFFYNFLLFSSWVRSKLSTLCEINKASWVDLIGLAIFAGMGWDSASNLTGAIFVCFLVSLMVAKFYQNHLKFDKVNRINVSPKLVLRKVLKTHCSSLEIENKQTLVCP